MRLFATLLLACLGLPLAAQDFDLRGLPAESNVIVAFRNTGELELSKLPAMQALREKMKSAKLPNAQPKPAADLEKNLREALGIDLEKDLQSVAVGILVGKPSPIPGASPDIRAAGILRGNFDPAKFEAFAAKHNLAAATIAGRKGWYMSDFIAALTGANTKTDRSSQLFVIDAGTILITQGNQAESSFACLAGQSPSAALPAPALALLPANGRNYGLLHVDATTLPASPGLTKSGLVNASLTLSEVGAQQVYKLSAEFNEAEKAKQGAGQLQGFLAMAPLFAMPNPKDTAEIKRLKQIGVKVLAGFEPTKLEDKRATAVLKIENADLVELIDALYSMALSEARAFPPAPAEPSGK